MKDLRDYKPVRDFLLETEIYDQLEEVAKNHHVPEGRVDEFLQLTDAVVKGSLPAAQMPSFIAEAFGLEEEAAKTLAADVAGYGLLPLENYLPEITGLITSWGGNVHTFPKKRAGKEETSPERFVEDLIQRLDLQIPDALTQRFTYLASGYLTGERTKESTKRILMRKLNIGGLEFTESMTSKFFDVLDKERKHFVLSEAEDIPSEQEEDENNSVEEVVADSEEKKEVATNSTKKEDPVTTPKKHVPSKFLPVITPLPIVSPKGRSVPDHGVVLKKKSFMTKDEMLQRIRSLTIDLPKTVKKVSKATKIAAKQTFTDEEERLKDLRPTKQDIEKEVNMQLAPVIELFREKRLPSIAFRDITLGFIKEERNASQTKDALITKHGFTGADASKILTSLEVAKKIKESRELPKVKILGKKTPIQKQAPVRLKKKRKKKETHALATSVPIISGLDLFDHEEKEITAHKQKVKNTPASKEAPKDQINALLVPAVQIFKKKKIERKTFDEFANAHIRGIRESRQTESLLKDRTNLNEKDRLVVMRAFNAARRVAEGEVMKKDKKTSKTDTLKKKEHAVLNRRHAAVTGSVPSTGVHAVMPSARVSAARTKEEELAMQHAIVTDEQIVSAQTASRPKKAKAKVTKKSVKAPNRKVVDVTFERRLAGPVEEIGKMTVTDFRRLSSDPKEAVRKIYDKLALLELTSYEERIAGVRAWRKNGVNRLYLDMSREALQTGKSVAEVAAERRNSSKESLSPNEVSAIVDLNGKIKF